jgi:NCAIR mutase (PurE)-related protein
MDVPALLEQVKNGSVSVEDAAALLKDLPYADLGFAKIDHHRQFRSGFGEVIYCAGKTTEQVAAIFAHFAERKENLLGTRATPAQYEAVTAAKVTCDYDPISGVLSYMPNEVESIGNIAVCAAGTSDLFVCEEVARTAEFFGSKVTRVYDVGVAGIHRLFDKLPVIREANCVVAVAGMEGALAGVIAGLVDAPVVAVPTSVGYGASFSGLSALLTMLNSCAEGIGVVNIDNGFGAGYLATQINRLAEKGAHHA